jgi:pimeloyl-ACP methyl ester carboxylesterase
VKAIRGLGPGFARLPDGVFRLIYQGFMLAGHDDRTVAGESLGEHLPFYLEAGGAAALVRQARSLDVRDTLDVVSRLPGLGRPARIVWGAADRFQPIGYGYRLAHDLGARLERVEGGKHFVPEDHPEPVARAVRAVLGRAG